MNLSFLCATIALVAAGCGVVGQISNGEILVSWQRNLNSGRFGVFTALPVDLGDVVNYFDSDPSLHWTLSNSDVGWRGAVIASKPYGHRVDTSIARGLYPTGSSLLTTERS